MRLTIPMLLACLLLVGCQAKPASRAAAGAPKVIAALTDQRLVYECPKCGMDYDQAGRCTMCDVDLVATRVSYLCPADEQPVEHAGKCPRCDANAKVVKSAVAEASPPAGGEAGGAKAPHAPGAEAPNGS